MTVKPIESSITDKWLLEKHYARRKCSRSFCFGLFNDGVLDGIVTYGQPASPQVGRGFVGEEYRNRVIELNRLCVNEKAPKNAASFLVGRSLRHMKDWVIVSYADGAMGHVGYIYQATNFIYVGAAKSHDKEYLVDGHWTHARSLVSRGITAPTAWAKENNIETRDPAPKHRYVFFGDKKLRKHLKYDPQPYPKGDTSRYECEDIVQENQMEMF